MKIPLSCKTWWCVWECSDILTTNNYARHQKLKAIDISYNTCENIFITKYDKTGTVFMLSG